MYSCCTNLALLITSSFLIDDNGTTYSTAGETFWVVNHTIGRDGKYFPLPDEFRPDRFMPPNEVNKAAWRPFERGPRNCIGQEVAMLEMKLIMALTLRAFAFETAYEEYDVLSSRKRNRGCKVAYGTRAYQTLVIGSKPKDGLPIRVRKL